MASLVPFFLAHSLRSTLPTLSTFATLPTLSIDDCNAIRMHRRETVDRLAKVHLASHHHLNPYHKRLVIGPLVPPFGTHPPEVGDPNALIVSNERKHTSSTPVL